MTDIMSAPNAPKRFDTKFVSFPEWMTVSEAAAFLEISTARVHELRNDGRFRRVGVLNETRVRKMFLLPRKEVEKMKDAEKAVGGRPAHSSEQS